MVTKVPIGDQTSGTSDDLEEGVVQLFINPSDRTKLDNLPTDTEQELDEKQSTSEKGIANGYASLDGSGKVPSSQIPAGTGSGDVSGPANNTDSYIPQWDGPDSKTLKNGIPTSTFAPALVADENYVTDAEKVVLGNTAGTNNGDQIAATVPVTPSGNLVSTDAQSAFVELQGDIDSINSSLGGLTDAVVLKGLWDASVGTFPGSGVAQAGWTYIVSVAGTVDGVAFALNDRLLSIADNASTTVFANNWFKLDYTDQVLSVAGKTGAVTLDMADLSETALLKIFTSTERTKLSGIEALADVTDAGNVGGAIDGSTAKTTPVDADTFAMINSVGTVLAKVTWANIKATLKAYFDTLYPTGSGTSSGTNTGDNATNSQYSGLAASKEAVANKDATGGYAGLTLFKINFKNAANTFTSFFTNANTSARTYTFQDRDGTIADNTDLALKAPLASPSFTGTVTTAGNIELGHASDTTLSRSSAGVIAVEGVVIPSISSTNTLTNKRITKRVVTTTQSATPAINTDNGDVFQITGLAQAITSMSSSLTGTPSEGEMMMIQITDNGTARSITWGASFVSGTSATLPTTTVISVMKTVLFQRVGSTWKCLAVD